MSLVTSAPATHLAVFLVSAELLEATSLAGRASIVAVEGAEPRFLRARTWLPTEGEAQLFEGPTSNPDSSELHITVDYADQAIFSELASFRELRAGWDGEEAAEPSVTAINEAARFARIAGIGDDEFEPTLHVDGSVILESANDVGSLRFKGDGQIIYALSETGYGVAPFDGFTVPEALRSALSV
jgi:hypothetical protein